MSHARQAKPAHTSQINAIEIIFTRALKAGVEVSREPGLRHDKSHDVVFLGRRLCSYRAPFSPRV